MNHKTQLENLERLSGSVDRVTYHSEETGFCVLRTKVKGQKDVVTVIGQAASISAGEFIECHGVWINDKEHGIQFKAEQLRTIAPTTIEGIEKYLGSGLIKGIGTHFAKVLVRAFGEQVFDIIEKEPHRLLKLPGIGKKRKECILSSWAEQKVIRDIMVFLQSHGVGTARAVRIYKTYGEKSIEIVRANPYKLALDIYGIGFQTADMLAMRLGIPKDSLGRAQAGVRHVVQDYSTGGHCAIEQDQLLKDSGALLEIPEPILLQAIEKEVQEQNLVRETIEGKIYLYLASLYCAEKGCAEHIIRLKKGLPIWGALNYPKALEWVEQKTKLQLSESQKKAVALALQEKVLIITGGPGVGKTTIVNSILKIVRTRHIQIVLGAPTGRAAKRLSETTGLEAKTIHRILEFDPRTYAFKYHSENPLVTDLVIIDEASMVDVVLMYNLLKAIPDRASLLIVGDVDQLPSVGPGAVLSDMIQSEAIPVVRLTEIFRQAATSQIIVNAHRINEGLFPLQPETSEALTDFYLIPTETPEEIQKKLLQVVTERIPERFGVNPLRDIQVLTPMNRGGLGSRSLNSILQNVLNPNAEPRVSRFGSIYSRGDKVIQLVNNYDKEVFNGDIGCIMQMDLEEQELVVHFDDRPVTYAFSELDELSLAYATSIHKSQGSEYPVVVIPLAMQHYMLLARNLLYTAVTRGKKLVVIIGQTKAISMAIKNAVSKKRITHLARRLKMFNSVV